MNTNLSNANCCISVYGSAVKCECLKFLNDKPAAVSAVARGLIEHFDLDASAKKMRLVDDYRHAMRLTNAHHYKNDGPQKTYMLPISVHHEVTDEESSADVSEATRGSISAWAALHNMGKKSLATVKDVYADKAPVIHGNTGKVREDENNKEAYAFIQRSDEDRQMIVCGLPWDLLILLPPWSFRDQG